MSRIFKSILSPIRVTIGIRKTYDSLGRPYELTYPLVNGHGGIVVRTEYSNGVAYKKPPGAVFNNAKRWPAR